MSFGGTAGFTAWFYAVILDKVEKACKNIFVKISLHLLGLIAIIFGLYFLIVAIPSISSIVGLLLMLIGLVIFVLPFGTKK